MSAKRLFCRGLGRLFFVNNLYMRRALFIDRISHFFDRLSTTSRAGMGSDTPHFKSAVYKKFQRTKSLQKKPTPKTLKSEGVRIFPLHRVIELSPMLASLAHYAERNILKNFDEFPIQGDTTSIEFEAESLLFSHILGKSSAENLQARFLASEVRFGRIFESVFLFKALYHIARLTQDLIDFEEDIIKGFSAKKTPRFPSNAFLFGILSKNPNATKLFLQTNISPQSCTKSLFEELHITAKEIEKIASILPLFPDNRQYINLNENP